MESIASSSTPPDHQDHRFEPTQSLAERVIRALSHRLRLLHRSDSTFFVLGATGNVYTVELSATLSCTCPDRTTPCKHILFVFIRVLGVSLDDSCLWRTTLRPCQLNHLLSLPSSTEAFAGDTVREVFHQLFFQLGPSTSSGPHVEIEDGISCPVCLEEMGNGEKIVACGTCTNPIHEECLMEWKKTSRGRSASCVLCRARWGNTAEQDKYLNLSPYISEDDMVADEDHCS